MIKKNANGMINFTAIELKALRECLLKTNENLISDFHGERNGLATAKAKICVQSELYKVKQ